VRKNFSGENLRILLRLVIFFMLSAPFYALYYQGSGAWVNQAEHLDRDLHILGITLLQDQVQSVNAILILVFIPLFAYGIYPLVERVVKLTPQRKMASGMFLLVPAFVIAANLEKRIVAGESPSVWWQLLAYAIVTAAEILVSVPALEFAYTQAPKKMKSMVMAAYLAGSISFGNFIAGRIIGAFQSDWLSSYVTGAKSPNYYWVFIGLIVISGVIFAIAAWLMPAKDFVAEDVPSAAVV
jgi:POT family proton-dependent oligopeptide transporter